MGFGLAVTVVSKALAWAAQTGTVGIWTSAIVIGGDTGVVGLVRPGGDTGSGALGSGLILALSTSILCRGTVSIAGRAEGRAAQTGTVGVGTSALGSVCNTGVLG